MNGIINNIGKRKGKRRRREKRGPDYFTGELYQILKEH